MNLSKRALIEVFASINQVPQKKYLLDFFFKAGANELVKVLSRYVVENGIVVADAKSVGLYE
jgi:hypothetical protein